MTLTLGSDHRVVNGAQAAGFLKAVVAQLERA
jgi:pyruvate/2-oxoglutarate dehydrogenase complex dihydrolipoamide acyltransferase (E2) component